MTTDLQIGQETSQHNQPFELVLVTRDADGNPTGTKNCIGDSGYKLSQFYLRHKGRPKSKSSEKNKADTKIVKQHDKVQAYIDTSERVVDETNVGTA